MISCQAYIEKILLHNKLADETQIEQLRSYVEQYPENDFLQVLVESSVISEKQAASVKKMYTSYQEKQSEEDVKDKQPITSHARAKARSLQDCRIMSFLDMAIERNASDLHFHTDSSPFVRKYGQIVPLDSPPIQSDEIEEMLFEFLTDDQIKTLKEKQVLDLCLSTPSQRFRCCIVKERCGWECAFRLIPPNVPQFEDLGLPPELLQLMEYNEGMILITGPSGSGKSTTLAALVELINQSRQSHIITLEEPIEYVFTPKKSHISQREIGLHTQSYASALRAALREDPDVIVIGELRDQETTTLAVTAAETGHLVFATLHTTSAAQTIHRLLDFFPSEQRNQIRAMVSESLHGVICQQLLPRKDGSGMALATEMLFVITAIANLVREDRIFQIPNMIQINSKRGMRLMDESLKNLVDAEVIAGEDAYFAANKRELFSEFAPKSKADSEDNHGSH